MNSVLSINTRIGEPETGIEKISSVAQGLISALADSQILLAKSQVCHWNATGPIFHSIHELTEEHYTNLFEAIDEIAERIRALGKIAPISHSELVSQSELTEWTENKDTGGMIESLVQDHQLCAKNMRDLIKTAEDHDDFVTADMLTERIAFHEKAVWMLKALAAK